MDHLWNRRLKRPQRCLIGLRSGELAGHFIVQICICFKYLMTDGTVWHGALSCMKIKSLGLTTEIKSPLFIENSSFKNGTSPFSSVPIYSFAPCPPHSRTTSGLILVPVKHAQTIIPTCCPFNLGTRQSFWYFSPAHLHTHGFCGSSPIYTIHSSDYITLFQAFNIKCLYAVAKAYRAL